MCKQCPLWVIAFAVSNKDTVTCYELNPPTDGRSYSASADCKESMCQMWDEERNDCGLKQPSQEKAKVVIVNDTQPHHDINELVNHPLSDEHHSELD